LGKRNIILIFCLCVGILISVGVYSYQSASQYKSATEWVNHTQEVIGETQSVILNIQSVESSQRGYVITGERKFLETYDSSIKNAEEFYSKVRFLTSDNASQQVLLDTILPVFKSKLAFVNKVIKTRSENGYDAAYKLIATNIGENLMNNFKSLFDRFINNEKTLLNNRLVTAEKGFTRTKNIIVTSILLTVAIFLLAFSFFIRDYNRRMHSEILVHESELRIKKFMESLPLGVFVLNADGNAFYSNKKSQEILGKGIVQSHSAEELPEIYKAYVAGTDTLYPGEQQPIARALRGEKDLCVEDMEIHKNGIRIPLRINATNITDAQGKIEFAMAVFEDVTDIREFEKKRIEAKKLAEQSSVLKETFLANMSHEIRTPMNAILGFTELLLKKDLDTEEKEFVRIIKSSGDSLLRIINDILDVSKIESGIMSFEEHPLCVSEMFTSINIILSLKAKEKGLQLSFLCESSVPNIVLGDPTRLTQILINLIGNSIKFTNTGSIKITAKVVKQENNLLHTLFSITDTGIGIAEDKTDLIFERFRQAESHTTRSYGGTGLGLSIAKQLVELQGGEINVKSTLGSGTTVTFMLPLKKAEESLSYHKENSDEIDMKTLSEKKILLVEDNPINIKFIRSLFEQFNIIPDQAENGRIAVEMLRKLNYDLVLMDIEMPEMNGYEATTIIRNELKINVPIIAMTAHALAGESEKCLRLGMNAYISKPLKEQILFNKMFSLINKSPSLDRSLPVNKLINLDFLVESMRGKKDVIRETLDMYLSQMAVDSIVLRDAVAEMNFPLIKQYSHRMKSTVSLVGITELEKILDELESLSIQKQGEMKIRSLHDSFVQLEKMAADQISAEKVNYS
jgi:PAS domain S-box-containing protein